MGKSLVSNAASAKNKKLGVAKSKSTTVGKKIVKKRVEIDLEQPKDRDPIDPNTLEDKRTADVQEVQRRAAEIEAERLVATQEARRSEHYRKSVSFTKKSGKERLENASVVDLRQPKEMDPQTNNDPSIQAVIDSLQPLFDFGLSTQEIVAIGYDKNSTQIQFGNDVFIKWIDEHNDRWTQALPRFDSPFQDFYAKFSVEVRVNMIFAEHENDWRRVAKFLISIFDDDALDQEKKKTEYIWGVRAIALQVSQQIPFSFFDIGLLSNKKISQDDLYFSRDDLLNPRLRQETPLVQFWLICSAMFDHPWAMLFDEFLDATPVECIQEMKMKIFDGFPNDETDKVAIHKGVKKIFDPDYDDSEDDEDPMGDEDNGLVNKSNQPDGWSSDDTDEEYELKKEYDDDLNDDEIKKKDDDGSDDDDYEEENDDVTTESAIMVESTRSTINNDSMTSRPEGMGRQVEIRTSTDETISELTGTAGEEHDPDLASPPRKKGRSQRVPLSNWATAMEVDGTAPRDTLRSYGKRFQRAPPSQPTTNQTTLKPTKEVKTQRKIQRSLTLEERLDELRNVDLNGMEGRALFVELAMVYNYQGQQEGNKSHASIILNHILDSLADILNNAEETLRILPLSDRTYKNVQMWIRTEADLRRLITDYRCLARYLDMSFGNMSYASTSNKPGEKKLRTRMRVGFEVDVSSEAIRQYLHGELQHQGRGAGCYESVLQFGDIEKIGALCFYPQEINIKSIEKELMRHFDWAIVIGLRYEWVNIPYNGRSKWNERAPGCMMWHVYVRTKHAKRVDRALRLWLHPSTPKKDFPWCAVTHYISDWKAAQNGTISVKAVGPVKDEILTMISKHGDFVELTQAKYCPVEIPGMLKQASTKDFGPRSCLSMFLSIKARPVHAEKVAAAEETSDSDSDDSLPDDISHKFTQVTTKGKTKIKKKAPKNPKPSLLDDGPVLTPAQHRRAREAERKRKMDLDNNTPSPLFIMVLPGEMEGTYLFISRLKYGALAVNVLKGLVPFFTHHLGESTTTQSNRVIGKWLSKSLIHTTRRKELVWCLETLRARPAAQSQQGVDEAIDFLDGFGSDPLDVGEALLEFDMEMADAKDIDDGATVAGAMDELLEKDSQLEAAITEIEFKDNLLLEQNSALDAERLRSEQLASELAAMRLRQQQPARREDLTSSTVHASTNQVSPDQSALAANTPPELPASIPPSTPARPEKPSPLMAPLPGSPMVASLCSGPQPAPAPLASSNNASCPESVTPDQVTCPPSSTASPPVPSSSGSNPPSLTYTQASGSQTEAPTPSVFPIFRHPQQSPSSVSLVRGPRVKKKASAGRGASRSTAGP